MAKLVFDESGKRFFEAGVEKCVLFPMNASGHYEKGVAWSGIIDVSEKPSGGESTPQWADNMKYINLTSAEEFSASISAFYYPNEFAKCDGSAELIKGITIGQQARQSFGLAYMTGLGSDTTEDAGQKLHIIYGCKVSPSEKGYKTKSDNPEAITFSWEVKATPVPVDGAKPTANATINSLDTDPAVWKKVCDAIYGTETKDSTILTPDELKKLAG